MRMFVVKAGTQIKVIKEGQEWYTRNFEDRVTNREQCFVLEDLRIDPVGRVGNGPGNVTVGSAWAERGWYGFQIVHQGIKYGCMMVPGNLVEII